MYIVEKYRPNAKNTEKRGRFRKCEKFFLATREKNFRVARDRMGGVEDRFFIGGKPMPDWKPAYEQANAVTEESVFRFSNQLSSTTC
jgi:hypothetical protein